MRNESEAYNPNYHEEGWLSDGSWGYFSDDRKKETTVNPLEQALERLNAPYKAAQEIMAQTGPARPDFEYACGNIECGAMFDYTRVSLGRRVDPNFCPDCGHAFHQEPQDSN
jgi:hypothetical protein